MGDISEEQQLAERIETSASSADEVSDGVAPGVLAAVILGVLCGIALLFSMAVLMDRWNTRFKHGGHPRSPSTRCTKITILDDMSPTPMSEPPQLEVAGPSGQC